MSAVTDKSGSDLAVQVVCVTYNQEKYVADALDSFVSQKTSFKFNILIGDDCSTDRTPEIIDEYVKKYPGLVIRVPREHNMGAAANLLDLCSKCTAPYLAFCDGDDFWTDDSKLQMQFDYMENHRDANVCFTQTVVKFEDEDDPVKNWYHANSNGEVIRPDCAPGYKPVSDFDVKRLIDDDVRTGALLIHTSCLFYRWNYSVEWPEWMYHGNWADIVILILQVGLSGVIHFIPKVTSCYRRCSGVTQSDSLAKHLITPSRLDELDKLYKIYELFKLSTISNSILNLVLKICGECFGACAKINDEETARWLLTECPEASWAFLTRTMSAKAQAEWQRNRISSVIGRPSYNMLADPANLKVVKQFVQNASGIDLSKPQSILNAKKAANSARKPAAPGVRARIRDLSRKLWDLVEFDSAFYLNHNADVAAAGIDAREHYIKYGFGEGRKCHYDNVTPKSLFSYWFGALYPKNRKKWAFGGFYARDNSFLDNTKYLFLHVVKHHPEIEAVWLAGSPADLDRLKRQGLPSLLMRSKEGKAFLRRAVLAVTDHYRGSDYENIWGFNAKTKVVNLWHGVGLKALKVKAGGQIASTTVPGVRLSPDIISCSSDSFSTKVKKRILYFFRSPFREMYEKCFFLLVPGPVMENFNGKLWNIPHKALFQCGMPRCKYLHSAVMPDRPKIIYAPTFRWNVSDEQKLVDNFINSIEQINRWLEKVDGTFTLRLHPHTWRSYGGRITAAIASYARFSYDTEKDVYGRLGQYSIMICDYSSIAYDFLLMNRPVVFFDFDFETFCQHDVDFWYPYEEYSPGLKARNWQEVIQCLDIYVKNPAQDQEWRDRIMAVQYYVDKNTKDDAERIVIELKKRLGI